MSQSVFSCDNKLDISYIPFMPASTKDQIELRIQIRSKKKGALLDALIFVDDKQIHSVKELPVERFYFYNHFDYYNEGVHTLKVLFKESDKSNFEESISTFMVNEERLPVLSGGFIMLGPPNDRVPCSAFGPDTKKMSDSDWGNYINQMNAIDIKCIIITVSVQLKSMLGENTAHYPSKLYPRSDIKAIDPIRAILRSAERNGQYVFIGLGHTYGGALPNTTDVMDELYALYGDSPAFYGWYESEEVNIRKYNPELWKRWKYLRDHAHSLSPVKPFIVSPYADGENAFTATGGVNPEFLYHLKTEGAPFDIIAPQDMVGHTIEGGRLTVKESTDMYRNLHEACKISKKHLWANCEAFDFNDDFVLVPRFNGGGMNGENGYIQQIQAVSPYSEKVTTFMLNGFFTPENFSPMLGGKPAVEQFTTYRNYLISLKK